MDVQLLYVFMPRPVREASLISRAERRFEVTASIEGGFSQAKVFILIRFFDCTRTGKPRALKRSKSKNDRHEISAVIIISQTKNSFWNTVRMRIL